MRETRRRTAETVSGSATANKLKYIAENVRNKKAAYYLAYEQVSDNEKELLRQAYQEGAANVFLREFAGFKKVEGTKGEDGKTVTNSKKSNKLKYISENCTEATAKILLKNLSDSAQKDEAITKLALAYGISAKEFAKYYSECLTYSSADIPDYLYTISGITSKEEREILYLATTKSKKGYNARLKSIVNSSNKLSFDDKNSILEALKK